MSFLRDDQYLKPTLKCLISGNTTSQIDSYSLAGHLIGSTNGTTTTYDLTDAEGSVLTTLSASAVLGEAPMATSAISRGQWEPIKATPASSTMR